MLALSHGGAKAGASSTHPKRSAQIGCAFVLSPRLARGPQLACQHRLEAKERGKTEEDADGNAASDGLRRVANRQQLQRMLMEPAPGFIRSCLDRWLNATASSYRTPLPPKMSNADPMVRSILPCPNRVTVSRSRQGACAARIGGRNRRPQSQVGDELLINAAALPFDVNGMNQELRAPRRQLLQALAADRPGR